MLHDILVCVHVCTLEQMYFLEKSFSHFRWQTRPPSPPVIPDTVLLKKKVVLWFSWVSGATSLQTLSFLYLCSSHICQRTFLSPLLFYCHVKSRPNIVDFGNWVLKKLISRACCRIKKVGLGAVAKLWKASVKVYFPIVLQSPYLPNWLLRVQRSSYKISGK